MNCAPISIFALGPYKAPLKAEHTEDPPDELHEKSLLKEFELLFPKLKTADQFLN